MTDRVIVIGAGLAGLAAASALGPRGLGVSILESRPRPGGRAGSFLDTASGQLVDACQHVSMGCCTNLAHFFRVIGVAHLLTPQRTLYFMTPDRRVSRLEADPLPAPLHLARSFLRAHYLNWREKLHIGRGLLDLWLSSTGRDLPFRTWLQRLGQPPRAVERFWAVVLTSALNEDVDRVGLQYARKVFVDGFLRHRRGYQVEVPTVPLGRLYGEELTGWLDRHGVSLRLNQGVRRLLVTGDRVTAVELRSGERMQADWYISAVPPDRLLEILPPDVAEQAYFRNLRRLETSPITSVHLWYDRAVTALPHAVLVDCVGQWLFNRGEVAPGEHYVQVVVSAARAFRGLGHDEVRRRIVAEVASLFPAAEGANLLRSRVVTEHHATFSAVPEVDQLRPPQGSPLANLLVAGDWTRTGWPATMEGAVRSGYLAAEELVRRQGKRVKFLRPDL